MRYLTRGGTRMSMSEKLRTLLLALAAVLAGGAGAHYAIKPSSELYAVIGTWQADDGGPSGSWEGIAQHIVPSDATAGAGAAVDASDAGAALPDASGVTDAAMSSSDAAAPSDASAGPVGILDPNVPGASPPGQLIAEAQVPLVPVGTGFVEPRFHTTVTRLAGESVMYSQLQEFSPDNALYIAASSGDYDVWSMAGKLVQPRLGSLLGATAPRWRGVASSPHELFWVAGSPARIEIYDLDTQVRRTAWASADPFAFGAQVHESASRDGRLTVLWAHDAASHTIAIYLVDMLAGAPLVTLSMADFVKACGPGVDLSTLNWVAPSPLGRYLVLSWSAAGISRCHGQELFDSSSGAFVRHVQVNGYHSDLGLSADGREILVTVETDGEAYECTTGEAPAAGALGCAFRNPWSNGYQSIIMQYLDGKSPPSYVRLIPYGAFAHISCQGPPGVCLVSANRCSDAGACVGSRPLLGEIYLVTLATGNVLRLADHRSSEKDYWKQSKATLSRNGSLAAFSSDWQGGASSSTNPTMGSVYVIDLKGIGVSQ